VNRVLLVLVENTNVVYAHAYDPTEPMTQVDADARAFFGEADVALGEGAELLGPAGGGTLARVDLSQPIWKCIGGETVALFLLGSAQ
jgi:hypothetical protein